MGDGGTSCRPLPVPRAPALKPDLAAAELAVASNEGGRISVGVATDAASSEEAWASISSTAEPPDVLLIFFVSASRGSSWHRWPILRLMHLVHGLSYTRVPARQYMIPIPLMVFPAGPLVERTQLGRGPDTYKVACHVLYSRENKTVSAALGP